MSWPRRFAVRMWALLVRTRLERELDDEVRFHLEMQAEDNLRSGMSAAEARSAAKRSFGGVEPMKEEYREGRTLPSIDSAARDLRYGLRMLRRSPVLTLTIILSLGLGIGANTAIFSLLDRVVFRTLPVKDPDTLVFVARGGTTALKTSSNISFALFERLQTRRDLLVDLFAYAPASPQNVVVGSESEVAEVQQVTGGYFSTLRVVPARGRPLLPSDDLESGGADGRVCVISHRFWMSRFEGAASALGKPVVINGLPFTVVGVTPAPFFGMRIGSWPDIYVPLMTPLSAGGTRSELRNARLDDRRQALPFVVGRLHAAQSASRAERDLTAFVRQTLRDANVSETASETIDVAPAGRGQSDLERQFSQPLVILMIIVAAVLLIACGNIANLLLSRATARQKEIAVRLSLGASRGCIIRQFVAESLLLAFFGGATGLVFATWAGQLLLRYVSTGSRVIPLDLSLDVRVFAFTAVAALSTGVLFGVGPAIYASRAGLRRGLGADTVRGASVGRPSARIGKALILCEVALALPMLIAAALFVRTLENLKSAAGFVPKNVLLVSVDPLVAGYRGAQIKTLYDELLARIERVPGVRSASLLNVNLLSGAYSRISVDVDGYAPMPGEDNLAGLGAVGARFFETVGMPIVRGRSFTIRDNETSPPVAVINETMAQYYFRDSDPIGRRLGFDGPRSSRQIEIIGVVRDAKYATLREATPRMLYRPYPQHPRSWFRSNLQIRTTGNPLGAAAAIRREIHGMDKNITVSGITTLGQQVEDAAIRERLIALLSSCFGLLAALLASIGLYGIMAYSVARRVKEIGIRMALGGRQSHLMKMIMRETLGLVAVGMVIGLGITLSVGRLISSHLYGITSYDPAAITSAVVLMIIVGLGAGLLPALRASRLDPVVALRTD